MKGFGLGIPGLKKTKGNDAMNAATFQAEVKKIEKLLYRIAWSYLGNEQDVQDAVQDALFKAWEKRKSLRDQAQFRAWLARILTNQCKNLLRRQKRWSFYPLADELLKPQPDPERAEIWEALDRLKPQQRVAVMLYYVDGYPLKEIAQLLGQPEGTMKTRLRAARKQLQKILLVEWEESN